MAGKHCSIDDSFTSKRAKSDNFEESHDFGEFDKIHQIAKISDFDIIIDEFFEENTIYDIENSYDFRRLMGLINEKTCKMAKINNEKKEKKRDKNLLISILQSETHKLFDDIIEYVCDISQ